MTVLELPPLPSGIRLLTNDESDRLKSAYPPSELPPDPSGCITCRGKGSFLWLDDAGQTAEYKCPCLDQWVMHRYFLHCGIGLAYQRYGWNDVKAEPGAIEVIYDYFDNAETYTNAGIGLVLHGKGGTGKTLLSTLILKRLLGEGHDGYFTTWNELIESFTAGWTDKADKVWFHRRVKNAGVLVIDDLGREYKGKVNLTSPTLDEVLRHRVAASRPTILTTNKDAHQVSQGYGSSIVSLLQERCIAYHFVGESFRERASQRLIDEARKGLIRPVVVG